MAYFILIIIVAAAGYFVSLRIHPLTKCRLCNGTGRHYGGVYMYAHRRCRKCGGNGVNMTATVAGFRIVT